MSHRSLQVAGVIRLAVAEESLRISPESAAAVSIVAVRVSPDFSYADIDVSAIQGIDKAIKHLTARRGALRKILATKLRMHRVPHLRFHEDVESRRGDRIDALLQRISSGETSV